MILSVKEIIKVELLQLSPNELQQLITILKHTDDEIINFLTNIKNQSLIVDGKRIKSVQLFILNSEIFGMAYYDYNPHFIMSKLIEKQIHNIPSLDPESDDISNVIIDILTNISQNKDSMPSEESFNMLSAFNNTTQSVPVFIKDIVCLDISNFESPKFYNLSSSAHRKQIIRYYSEKCNERILLKDLRITKLYYNHYALIGYNIQKDNDSEIYFWSDLFQNLLEAIPESRFSEVVQLS